MQKEYIYLKSTSSTNDWAAQLCNQKLIEYPTCIYTYDQTSGKGQFNRTWHSEKGKNLTVSIVIPFDKLAANFQVRLNKAIALRVRSYLSVLSGQKLTIKWPNDIYFEDSKIAGLLIQNSISQKDISYSIIGIGINVNETIFPSEIPNPSSLKIITNKEWNLLELIQGLFVQMQMTTEDIIVRNDIESIYNKHLYRLDEIANFSDSGGINHRGVIQGVDEKGRMLIKNEKGLQSLVFGEVKMKI